MTKRVFIKVVPDNAPNADGHWVECPGETAIPRGWWRSIAALGRHAPEGHHMIQAEMRD